jgi:Family of unknown function (DUF5947)
VANGSRPQRRQTLRRGRSLASPRLRALAAANAEPAAREQAQEQCELCGEPLQATHNHLLDLRTRQLMCACRACSLLFDRDAAGGGHYRLVGDRRLRLEGFELDDAIWEELRIPVEMACFYKNSESGRVAAFYPSPMGATESRLELSAWREIEQSNQIVSRMRPDVEALIVNRTRGARDAWIVPIEDPYRLVAIIRTHWRGFTGGKEVWLQIDQFFEQLDRRAERARAEVTLNTAERR